MSGSVAMKIGYGEAISNLSGAIEDFNNLVTNRAAKLASCSASGCELDATKSGVAVRAGNVVFLHEKARADQRAC